MTSKHSPLLLLLLGTLFLSACLAQPHPNKNTYALEAAVPEPSGQVKARQKTMLVGTVAVAAGFENRAFIYRTSPNKLEADFYNEFMAPPARLLADQAAQYLDAANKRLRVVKSPGMIIADFGLETYLESILGDFTQNPPRAVISIRFTVNNLQQSPVKAVLDKTYRHETVMAGKSPENMVIALNNSLTAILAELNQDLEKKIR